MSLLLVMVNFCRLWPEGGGQYNPVFGHLWLAMGSRLVRWEGRDSVVIRGLDIGCFFFCRSILLAMHLIEYNLISAAVNAQVSDHFYLLMEDFAALVAGELLVEQARDLVAGLGARVRNQVKLHWLLLFTAEFLQERRS